MYGKNRILHMIKKVATICDSYDSIIFFYTAHGRPHSYSPFFNRIYLFDANNHHSKPNPSDPNDLKWSKDADLSIKDLDIALKEITCQKLFLILQPCFSGNWIENNLYEKNQELLTDENIEQNRIVFTSEIKSHWSTDELSKLSIFDKCNPPSNELPCYVYTVYGSDESKPKYDGEEYESSKVDRDNDGYKEWRYYVKDDEGGKADKIYEIDITDDGTIDFYENYEDTGAEFISGITESFYKDRDYNGHPPDNCLDADTNDNDFISCKEAYKFMLDWHLGYNLGKGPNNDYILRDEQHATNSPPTYKEIYNPWFDHPQISYTSLQKDLNFLFY
jgi:hypothetical protein